MDMCDNAKLKSCDIVINTNDEKYGTDIRKFQGCPTLAVTREGRIFLGWYAGGCCEPHMENYNLLIYSDDGGNSWSNPIVIIPSDRQRFVHALDIQLFVAPDGKLHVCWVQNNTKPAPEKMPEYPKGQPAIIVDGFLFDDFRHTEWEIICDDPDAENLIFSAPRNLCDGFLRCKPTFLKNGDWLFYAYSQLSKKYRYYISNDQGCTYLPMEGAEKTPTWFDEAMAYERLDGSIRMLARTSTGELSESISFDGGHTWTDAMPSGIDNPDTRFFIARTPSGRILLVNNDSRTRRENMTVYLSEDDGKTFEYKKCIDSRDGTSYPDVDFYDGKIYLTYDRERTDAKEILFTVFDEDDIMNPEREISVRIVSKPNI